jgi:hypothetical protein
MTPSPQRALAQTCAVEGYSPGTPRVLPGYSRGTPGVLPGYSTMPFPQGALARPAHPLRLALARAVAPALALVGEFEADACARPPALVEYSRVTQTVPRVLWVLACPVRPPSLRTHAVPSGTQAVPVRKPGQSTHGYSPREPSSGRARAGEAGCITSAY